MNILIPFGYASALPGDAELVLENILIEPTHPKKGESIIITGEIYNSGKSETGSLVSIITIAFFVDGKLLDISDIGNIKPGIGNKVKISSESIWKAEPGNHIVKIIVDYHNTLSDQHDSPSDNILEKTFFVDSLDSTKIFLDTVPQYGIQGKESRLNVTALLVDYDSNNPLNNKKIIFNLEGEKIELITNEKGKVSFPYINNFFNTINAEVHFEGDSQYLPSNSSSIMYSLPKEITSAMIIKIQDVKKQYNFVERPFEIIIFQDSYQGIVKKIQPNSSMLFDSETFWIALPPEHDYFAEIYLDGEFFSMIDKERLKENSLIIKEVEIPETASIKFRVINDENIPINEGIVKSWIYSIPIENGFTDWIDIIPTTEEPYSTEIILPDQGNIKSKSFSVFPGERKIITLKINLLGSEIPDWVKNNAGWWADGTIDDETFTQAIQFMIKEGVIKIPATSQDSDLNSDEIPDWVKNNAGWWADGTIDDETFTQAIQFMIKEGVIKV